MEYLYNCRGGEKPDKDNQRVSPLEYHRWSRADAYGIFTGLYCDKCYNDSFIYTYRKDDYYDEGYAGEQLYPDE